MTNLLNVGWDTETHLIGMPDIIPRMVCCSWDAAPAGGYYDLTTTPYQTGSQNELVLSTGDQDLWQVMREMWLNAQQERTRIIIHNAPFDITVALRYCQDVFQGTLPGNKQEAEDTYLLIWEVLEQNLDMEWTACTQGRRAQSLVSDTLIREKLKNLSAHGGIDVVFGKAAKYSLADLVMKHFKINVYDKKVSMGGDGRIFDAEGRDITGTPEAGAVWRLRYKDLDGIPVSEWPPEAFEYALQDATWARLLWESQEKTRKDFGAYSMNSEALQIYSGVCLSLATANGFRVDSEQRERIEGAISSCMAKIEPLLKENGIVRSNGSVNTKLVKSIVERKWDELGRSPLLTETGEVATNKEVMEILAHEDPLLQVFAERQVLAKLRDAFLPSLRGERVYTTFDVVKETGRTSSRGSSEKNGRKVLFAAVNSQQIPRRKGIREMFLPDPGYLIVSVDYGALELCSVAQCTYNLFGASVHRDKINQGYDLHSFLGAGLARMVNPMLVDEWQDLDRAYQAFMDHRFDPVPKDDDSPEANHRRMLKDLAKHFRNLAKPVGLGYPGGLSTNTLCVFARTVYHVDISPRESASFKQLWLELYPEMVEYFEWVRNQRDGRNRDEDHNSLYCYETPGFRRFRGGATYCATANGASMQSLSADGAKRGLCWLGRACAGGLPTGSPHSILDACKHLSFIHDEHLVAIPDDPLATVRALAIQDLMIQGMAVHMPDVRLSAEPAMMRRWIKAAEPIWDHRAGQQDQVWRTCREVYGTAVADAVVQTFQPAKGPDYRLVPWDDENESCQQLGGFEVED